MKGIFDGFMVGPNFAHGRLENVNLTGFGMWTG